MLHWPIRVIRIVTDPVVDSIFFVISYLILPSIVRLFDGFFTATVWGLSAVVPRDALEKSVRFVHTTVSLPQPLLRPVAKRALERECYEFPLGYNKRFHRLPHFKARGGVTSQHDPIPRHPCPGINASNSCEGRALLWSFRQAGQGKFIPSCDWLDTNGPRGWDGGKSLCYCAWLCRHWTTNCLLPERFYCWICEERWESSEERCAAAVACGQGSSTERYSTLPKLTPLLGGDIHHHRTGFIPIRMRHQPRLMFHLAFSRSEPSVANCVLPVRTPDGNILSLGCGHDVHVGRFHWYDFCR